MSALGPTRTSRGACGVSVMGRLADDDRREGEDVPKDTPCLGVRASRLETAGSRLFLALQART